MLLKSLNKCMYNTKHNVHNLYIYIRMCMSLENVYNNLYFYYQ